MNIIAFISCRTGRTNKRNNSVNDHIASKCMSNMSDNLRLCICTVHTKGRYSINSVNHKSKYLNKDLLRFKPVLNSIYDKFELKCY